MKILCLYSDWRWTGPAEPVLQMCRGLQDRGHDVVFACRKRPETISEAEEDVPEKAAGYGLNCTTEFALDRYMGIRNTLHDLHALPRYIRAHTIDVLHTNLSHDHALGAIAARLCGGRRPLLVKTMHRRKVPRRTRGYRSAMTGFLRSDGILVFTPSFRREYIDRFGIPPERIDILPMTIDTERFSPERHYTPMRPEFGIPEDAVVIGIVTRFQKYRRMDVFVEAAARVIAARSNVYFLLLGWSGQIEDTVIKPIREHRVEKNVLLAGYRIDDYEDTLACMDIFTLLMPGFDGTARAVREAMAMGKPCVVSDIGMLPEIVEHGKSGLVSPLEVDALTAAWLTLVDDPQARKSMGKNALETARSRFKLGYMAQKLEQSYTRWLNMR